MAGSYNFPRFYFHALSRHPCGIRSCWRTQWTLPDDEIINVPMGYAAFPKEIRRPPRSVAVRNFTNIRQWTEMPKGGHFAALEQPRLLAEDVGKFFDSIIQF